MTEESFLCSGRLALDTEFVWTKTYRARLGLVQAAASGGLDAAARLPLAAIPFRAKGDAESRALLFDPLRSDPAPLGAVLADEGVAKLLHDAHQDLQHLSHWTGCAAPRSVFDTRVAAGFCGLPSTLSLARLVEETCGVALPKTETRTDWCRRPLSPEQLEYAAQDVVYLEDAAQELLRRARAAGTAAWLFEEMARYDDPALYADPPDEDAWRRVRHVPPQVARDPEAMRRLRALAAWRERTARERDLPRKWVVADETIAAAAARPPASARDLPPRAVPASFQAGFLATLRECAEAPFALEAESAAPRRDAEEMRRAKDRATALLAEIARRAEALKVDPALVATRAEATDWILDPDDPAAPLNRGWRREAVGDALRRRF